MTKNAAYEQLAKLMIKHQEEIIGPIAWSEANKVSGLVVSDKKITISKATEGKQVIDQLVKQYQNLFGQTSVEVCKDATRDVLQTMEADSIPTTLL